MGNRQRLATYGLAFGSICALATAPTLHAQQASERQVAAPASDLSNGRLRLPDPWSARISSSAAIQPLEFAPAAGGDYVAVVELPIDAMSVWTAIVLSPSAPRMQIFAAPLGMSVQALVPPLSREQTLEFVGDAMPGWVARVARVGPMALPPTSTAWRFEVRAPTPDAAWLLVDSGGGLRAEAWVSTHERVSGEPIAILARAAGRDWGTVERAQATVELNGSKHRLVLRDEGLDLDGAANDGTFGALLPFEWQGEVHARVDVLGLARAAVPFRRSVPLDFAVEAPRLELNDVASAEAIIGDAIEIAIEAIPLAPSTRMHVSAEVWGRDPDGGAIPVCWLSKIQTPREAAGLFELPLELDLRWLDVAQAQAPLELRAVRVQSPDNSVVWSSRDAIFVAAPSLRPPGQPRAAGPDLWTRPNRSSSPPTPPHGYAAKRSLMLVHGYCSGGSIWPAADFSAPKLEFLDPNQNRTHDQFAQLIAQRAAQAQLYSFGVVAHSQGGPAALHLLTYYESGLDRASGGRKIQSLASPYQGTPLASLGGFACGVNSDMTPSGAAAWLAGIPTWARAQVFGWTTSNISPNCNALAAIFLADPEDGTVEQARAQLPGGNDMGHVTGWCHTTGMARPASYTDSSRNTSMNANAAR